ncbi:MAG TPA: thermonuclease family protein [Eoetvoesiella sp.]
MNKALNIVVSRLVAVLFSGGRFRMLASFVALALAALGGVTAFGPGARPSSSQNAAKLHGAYQLTGRVVQVADGDTFTLLTDGRQHRVRLASIDAPETTKDRKQPGQPMAQRSKEALSHLIAGKTVDLSCYERDHYQRNICDVRLPDGSTANQQQVATGMAWANMEGRGKYMRDPKLPALEDQARRDKLGLWRDGSPVQPWVWRYQCWKQAKC